MSNNVKLQSSPEHLFLVKDSNIFSWKKVCDIQINDILLSDKNLEVTVVRKETLSHKEDLYDLQVADVKEFYANGIVSHNSSILDAVCFCLFNKPFRKINRPNLVNFKNKKDLYTEIEFCVNNVEYKVCRGISPNIFEIYENNILLNQPSSTKDYQSILENEILNYDYNSFSQLVIIGKATYISFMKLTTQQRREFIENILGLNIFGLMSDVHKQNVQELKTLQNDNKNNIIVTQEKIKLAEQYIKKLEADEKNSKEEQNNKLKSLQKELKQNLLDINSELEQLESEKKEFNETEFTTLQERVNKLNSAKTKTVYQLNTFKKEHKFLNDNNICSTCGQDIHEDFKIKKLGYIDTKKNELTNLNVEIENKLNSTEQLINDINEVLTNNRKIDNRINILKSKKNDIKKQAEIIKNEKTAILENYISKITDEQKNLDNLLNEYNILLDLKNEYFIQQEYNVIKTTLLKDSGIKKSIITQYIEIINKSINDYLQILGFYAYFKLDEEFNEEILARGINKLNYNNFSEGEKMRIDLAILLTWRDIAKFRSNKATNLLMFDDMLSIVDSQGIKAIIDVLQVVPNLNTFIISPPNETLSENIDNVISIEKINGFSEKL